MESLHTKTKCSLLSTRDSLSCFPLQGYGQVYYNLEVCILSSVNYSLNNKGVRLIDAQEAWVKGKNGKVRLNPKYSFIGKVSMSMPNMIVTASDKKKPAYRGDVGNLNKSAKKQMVNHFYNDDGKRNKKSVAYFGIEKTKK